MKRLSELQNKKKKLVIGLMSGTSIDGIDAALIQINGNGIKTRIKKLFFKTYPYPKGLKEFILKNSLKDTSNVEDICRLNFLIGKLFAKAAMRLCKDYGISIHDVDLIGSHGQTIHHLPQKTKLFGETIRSTLQIGDPSVIAKITGIPTVGDFRVGDMALDGEGAPLVPYFDYVMFRSEKVSRALLNIGGIANITFLKKGCTVDDVIAFDTGPGNMMIDYLMQKLFNKKFDKNGKIASQGNLIEELFQKIFEEDSFVKKKPPKSTGREFYNKNFVEKILREFKSLRNEDIITTFTEYTSFAIYFNYEKFIKDKGEVTELLVSGGGSNNSYIMNSLKKYFGQKVKVKKLNSQFVDVDSKEAICFALFANETIHENSINIPSVTGAKKKTILGKICL
ncbi:MAG: anhydro-N-acetylmuramic acid kinase [Ignavibacteria bacterium]|nr:anhydro-N-acetylmuramic acid kinase [Ignavibacteria bacterium]